MSSVDQKTRVLFVAAEWPVPPRTGGHTRTLGLIELLARQAQVDILAPASRFGSREVLSVPNIARSEAAVASWPRRAAEVARGASRHRSTRLAASMRMTVSERQLRQFAGSREYDLVILDQLLAASAAAFSRVRDYGRCVVYSAHNVEYRLPYPYPRVPESLRHALDQRDVRAMEAYERHVVGSVDGVMCVSAGDSAHFAEMGARELCVIPNCPLPRDVNDVPWADRTGLILTGSFGWGPNREGLQWFIREVLPEIRRSTTELAITVAGNRVPAPERRQLVNAGVSVVVGADNLSSLVARARVCAVPLLTGGGSRVRIVESLAAGTPVVATTKGAEGQPHEVMRGISIEDDALRFALRVKQIAQSPQRPPIPPVPSWEDSEGDMRTFLARLGVSTAEPD
jgi:polysaccharide biosynthesis protein PslH